MARVNVIVCSVNIVTMMLQVRRWDLDGVMCYCNAIGDDVR